MYEYVHKYIVHNINILYILKLKILFLYSCEFFFVND